MYFLVRDHNSIAILIPVTSAAADWMARHLLPDYQRWAGGVAVEPRYLPPILRGTVADGLEVGS